MTQQATNIVPPENAFETAPIGGWLLTRHGLLTHINKNAREYIAVNSSLRFEDWIEYIHQEDRQHMRQHWNDMWLHNQSFAQALRILRPDGSYSWIEVRFQPSRKKFGQTEIWVCTAHSLAAQKILEQQLNDQNLWLRSISHDLRQPLLAIDGYSTLLEEQIVEPQTNPNTSNLIALLARLRENVARMRGLVETQLGTTNGNPETFSLGELTNNIAATIQNQNPNTTIELPAHWPILTSHRSSIDRILTNLMNNAMRYATESQENKIRVEWSEDNGLLLRVHDSGKGVDTGSRQKVFEAHWRDENSPGYGLGLTIVKSLVEAQSGQVWIEDSPLGGACFSVHLPKVLEQTH